jgi:23S rRNA (uracil1939-C5)-methyltransferase
LARIGGKMIQKNDDYEVDIIDEGYEGEGIAKIDGYTTFIKGAISGEKTKIKILKANKDFGFGKLLEVLSVSKNRQEPVCAAFNKCGGCSLQHMDYEYQLNHKKNIVLNSLKKALGFNVEVNETIGMGIPYNYRNKAQYPVSNNKIGFFADRSHNIVENDNCYIQNSISDKLAKDTFKLIQKYKISIYDEKNGKGLIRHIVTRIAVNTGELMLILVTNGEQFKEKNMLIDDIVKLYPTINSIVQNINTENNNVILGDKCITLYGDDYITDILGDFKFKISPLSFYQVNPVQTELLYNTAKEFADLTGKETVFDLYSGIGTISIFMSDKAEKIYSVEVVEAAVEDAKENAKLNNIDNIEFVQGEAETIVPELYEKNIKADVVFIDPPRKGCEQSLLNTIAEMKTEKVIYISCNPATLARDLKYLTDNGYKIEKVQPVDMFPQTSHVETVVLMSQR